VGSQSLVAACMESRDEKEEADAEKRERERGVGGSRSEEEEKGRSVLLQKCPSSLFFCSKLFNNWYRWSNFVPRTLNSNR